MKKFMEEFKAFAIQGNVLDMAVGVVIGTAFGKIVASLVGDILMPLVGLITGGANFSELVLVLDAKTELTLNYGAFIQSMIDFGIIAFSIFIFIKMINKFTRKPEPIVEDVVVEDTLDQQLLKEILVELKKSK